MSITAKYLSYLPIATLAIGLVGSYFVNGERMQAHAEELLDLGESVDENEDAIEQIQRLLIQRQGEVALQVQRIEHEQNSQGDDLAKILLLLQQLQAQGR